MNKLNRILVTGGAGFIGSHLCKRLICQNHEVVCIDNLLTGTKKNIYDLLDKKNFLFKKADVKNKIDLDGFDQIYNLACPASPIHYQENPIDTIQTNVLGSLNVLEVAKKNNSKILQASTSEVYGDPEVHPQPENYKGKVNPIGIRACYDEGKRCAETLFFDYNRQHNVQIKVIRIFNTYGPSMLQNDGRVVSNFIVQALEGHDITIYGDGKQTRSFQYIDDLIDGMIKMMDSEKEFLGPVNLGNPNEFTILELAHKILAMIPESNSKIIFKPLPKDDPLQRKPDILRAKKNLNWKPEIELNEGLQKTIKYFKNILS